VNGGVEPVTFTVAPALLLQLLGVTVIIPVPPTLAPLRKPTVPPRFAEPFTVVVEPGWKTLDPVVTLNVVPAEMVIPPA
jgi:hypothetical protein